MPLEGLLTFCGSLSYMAFFLILIVWFTLLTSAGTYLYCSYNMALVRTPPWWVETFGDVPLQLIKAALLVMGQKA